MKQTVNILISAILAILTSCNHKDLCDLEVRNAKIRVAYDWRDAPDATATGMCVFFYSADIPGRYYRFDFSNTTGGEIEIPQGRYMLITYNNDTEVVRFSATDSYDSHRAFTRTADLLEPLYGNGVSSSVKPTNGERVFLTPDALWGCHATDITVAEHSLTYRIVPYPAQSRSGQAETTDTQVITLFPHDMLCHYTYEVRNVDQADHISKISASLSGMSAAMTLNDEALDTESITLPVGGKADPSTSRVTGSFLTFGHYGTATAPHRMAFFVVMDDGSKYRVEGDPSFDVTSQVDNAPDRRHVHIVIDHLHLPKPADDDEGWSATVDDWGVQNEDLLI